MVAERDRPPAPTRDNTCAVVVTYHPDAGLEERLAAVRGLVASAVVVDNGSDDADVARLRRAVEDWPALRVVLNGENCGVARALNQGVLAALAGGAAWVLTFDQDSHPDPDFLSELAAVVCTQSDPLRLAAVGAWYGGERGATPHGAFAPVGAVITSGSLFPASSLRALGPFDEALFIDLVDIEFCIRARQAGFYFLRSVAPLMRHSIGHATTHRLPWGSTRTFNHPPMRHFYAARNTVVVARRYFRAVPWEAVHLLLQRAKILVLVALFEERRPAKLAAALRGLWAGLRGDLPAPPRGAGV